MYMYTYLWKMSLIFSILTNKNKGYTYMNTYKILVLLLIYLKYEKMSVHTCMLFQTTLNQNKWLRKNIIRNFVAMINLRNISVVIQILVLFIDRKWYISNLQDTHTHTVILHILKIKFKASRTLIGNLNSEPESVQ